MFARRSTSDRGDQWTATRLARRIPDERLAERATFIKRGLATLIGVFVVGIFCVGLLARGGGAFWAGCVGIFLLLAFVALGVMYLLMLVRLSRSLHEQARIAIDTWAAAPVAAPVHADASAPPHDPGRDSPAPRP